MYQKESPSVESRGLEQTPLLSGLLLKEEPRGGQTHSQSQTWSTVYVSKDEVQGLWKREKEKREGERMREKRKREEKGFTSPGSSVGPASVEIQFRRVRIEDLFSLLLQCVS